MTRQTERMLFGSVVIALAEDDYRILPTMQVSREGKVSVPIWRGLSNGS